MASEASPDPEWTLTVFTQERGTKQETAASLNFAERDAAVTVAKEIESQLQRGPFHAIAVECPTGERLSFMATDFRRTKLERFFSGML